VIDDPPEMEKRGRRAEGFLDWEQQGIRGKGPGRSERTTCHCRRQGYMLFEWNARKDCDLQHIPRAAFKAERDICFIQIRVSQGSYEVSLVVLLEKRHDSPSDSLHPQFVMVYALTRHGLLVTLL